jgi:hypothetical protein
LADFRGIKDVFAKQDALTLPLLMFLDTIIPR